jgi:hypothetical protein
MVEEGLLLLSPPAGAKRDNRGSEAGLGLPGIETDNFHAPDSHRLDQEPVTLLSANGQPRRCSFRTRSMQGCALSGTPFMWAGVLLVGN